MEAQVGCLPHWHSSLQLLVPHRLRDQNAVVTLICGLETRAGTVGVPKWDHRGHQMPDEDESMLDWTRIDVSSLDGA